jgi:hypothetical protein
MKIDSYSKLQEYLNKQKDLIIEEKDNISSQLLTGEVTRKGILDFALKSSKRIDKLCILLLVQHDYIKSNIEERLFKVILEHYVDPIVKQLEDN